MINGPALLFKDSHHKPASRLIPDAMAENSSSHTSGRASLAIVCVRVSAARGLSRRQLVECDTSCVSQHPQSEGTREPSHRVLLISEPDKQVLFSYHG